MLGFAMRRPSKSSAVLFLALSGASLLACTGKIGLLDGSDDPVGSSPEAFCEQSGAVSETPFERLTRDQYDNTVEALFGDTSKPAQGFLPDTIVNGWERGVTTSAVLVEQHQAAAEQVAKNVRAKLSELVTCDSQELPRACAEKFIDNYAERAYRRPISAQERADLLALYDQGTSAEGELFEDGIELVVQGLLMSPYFLYRVELGRDPAAAPGSEVELTDFELASRLSYFLWNSMPDAELFERARAGKLSDKSELETEARRMLADERAQAGLLGFYRQWVGLDGLPGLARDPELYPGVTETTGQELAAAFGAQMIALHREGASFRELLMEPATFVNQSLAELYGVSGVSGPGFKSVSLPGQRAGLLTHPALLARLAEFDHGDVIDRGLFVRRQVLCQELPDPPPDVPALATDTSGLSNRERFDEHSKNPSCKQCHQLIDPIGFAFENYDAIGRWRDQDQGQPVDASGELVGTEDADGAVNGAYELSSKLVESIEVQSCFAEKWLEYGLRRPLQAADRCVASSLANADRNLDELVLEVVRSEAFRKLRVVEVKP
jgi:hypothetical protein